MRSLTLHLKVLITLLVLLGVSITAYQIFMLGIPVTEDETDDLWNIDAKVEQVCRVFKLPRSQVCAIAAEEGYGLAELVEKIVAILPNEKKWSFTREAKQENVSQQAWQSSSQGLWESITSAVKTVIKDSWDYVSSRLSSLASTLFGWW